MDAVEVEPARPATARGDRIETLGDAALFPQNEEVEESWRVIDPIEQLWAEQQEQGLHLYRAGEWGPKAADEMLAGDGRAWRRP